MTIKEVDQMCQVVEAFILKKKGERVTINRTRVIMDVRQLQMLIHAFNVANAN
jgi:hypothetical protein